MKSNFIKILTLFTLLFSCAPSISNLENYQKQFISKSDYAPDEATLNSKIPKVVVFDFEENEIEVAKQSSLGKSVAKNVENIISKYRLAELVDRSASSKLQKEIQLSEMNKTGSYKGPKIADYAISGSISNASFSGKYSAGSTFINPKNGQIASVPPKYTYKSEFSGNLKIYELPSLTVVKNIQLGGTAGRSENVQQNGGVSFGGLQIGGQQVEGVKRDDGLVRNAALDAIEGSETELRNSLSKKGYILEKRSYNGDSIFKINLGSEDGIEKGDNFEIYGQYEVENSISGKSEVEIRLISLGRVTDKIDPKTCWVVISNKKVESSVRIGDSVKMIYSNSSIKSIIRLIKKSFL